MLKLNVNSIQAGVKPIGFLKKQLDADFHIIKTLIVEDKIRINNNKIDDNYILKENDLITIKDNSIKLKKKKKSLKPINLKIEEIFEDENILVLNKPTGLVVQENINQNLSLSNHLEYLKQKKNLDYLHIIHRIDKYTSGIIICAKSPQILRDLHLLLKEKKFEKNYICLVKNKLKKSSGKIELFLKITDNSAEKVKISKNKSSNKDKYSLSYYKLDKEYKYKNQVFSLVNVNIKTGITHQIRVHMKYLDNSIVGDIKYGCIKTNDLFKKLGLKRHFLHSYNTKFIYKNKKYNLIANLPKELKDILRKLK